MRGTLPVVIVRPSIIQGCYKDPFAGWTDTIAASGFQMLMTLNGMYHFIHGSNNTVLDVVPCDFVSNAILVQTVYTAIQAEPQLNVIHSCTSVANPLKIKQVIHLMKEYDR